MTVSVILEHGGISPTITAIVPSRRAATVSSTLLN
jgi:hypothetical protein